MAVRSGAGTGVIVSLIVFIVLTIAMLVMTIVFYSRQTEALEAQAQAIDDLETYVRPTERSSDRFAQFEQQAGTRQSVSGYLASRYDELASFVTGGESSPIETLRSEMANYGVDENGGIRGALRSMQRETRNLQDQIAGLERQLQERDRELSARDAELADLRAAHAQEREQLREEVVDYRESNEQSAADPQAPREPMEERV